MSWPMCNGYIISDVGGPIEAVFYTFPAEHFHRRLHGALVSHSVSQAPSKSASQSILLFDALRRNWSESRAAGWAATGWASEPACKQLGWPTTSTRSSSFLVDIFLVRSLA